MAYMDTNGTLSMEWYWVGAILSYLFSLISGFFIYRNFEVKKISILDSGLIILSSILMWETIIWTTIIIILWQADFDEKNVYILLTEQTGAMPQLRSSAFSLPLSSRIVEQNNKRRRKKMSLFIMNCKGDDEDEI